MAKGKSTTGMTKEQRREYNQLTNDCLKLTDEIWGLIPAIRVEQDELVKDNKQRELVGLFAQRDAINTRREYLYNGRCG